MIGVALASASAPVAPSPSRNCKLAHFAELLEHLLHAGGVASVENLDSVFDLFDRRDHDFDVASQSEAQIFRGARFQRIGQSDPQSAIDKSTGSARCNRARPAGNDLHDLGSDFSII